MPAYSVHAWPNSTHSGNRNRRSYDARNTPRPPVNDHPGRKRQASGGTRQKLPASSSFQRAWWPMRIEHGLGVPAAGPVSSLAGSAKQRAPLTFQVGGAASLCCMRFSMASSTSARRDSRIKSIMSMLLGNSYGGKSMLNGIVGWGSLTDMCC